MMLSKDVLLCRGNWLEVEENSAMVIDIVHQ
jgi:hypothetical protein